MMEEHLLKIDIVGEPGVGKTTAINRFVSGKFNSDTKSTIGVDFSLKHVPVNLDKKIMKQHYKFGILLENDDIEN